MFLAFSLKLEPTCLALPCFLACFLENSSSELANTLKRPTCSTFGRVQENSRTKPPLFVCCFEEQRETSKANKNMSTTHTRISEDFTTLFYEAGPSIFDAIACSAHALGVTSFVSPTPAPASTLTDDDGRTDAPVPAVPAVPTVPLDATTLRMGVAEYLLAFASGKAREDVIVQIFDSSFAPPYYGSSSADGFVHDDDDDDSRPDDDDLTHTLPPLEEEEKETNVRVAPPAPTESKAADNSSSSSSSSPALRQFDHPLDTQSLLALVCSVSSELLGIPVLIANREILGWFKSTVAAAASPEKEEEKKEVVEDSPPPRCLLVLATASLRLDGDIEDLVQLQLDNWDRAGWSMVVRASPAANAKSKPKLMGKDKPTTTTAMSGRTKTAKSAKGPDASTLEVEKRQGIEAAAAATTEAMKVRVDVPRTKTTKAKAAKQAKAKPAASASAPAASAPAASAPAAPANQSQTLNTRTRASKQA